MDGVEGSLMSCGGRKRRGGESTLSALSGRDRWSDEWIGSERCPVNGHCRGHGWMAWNGGVHAIALRLWHGKSCGHRCRLSFFIFLLLREDAMQRRVSVHSPLVLLWSASSCALSLTPAHSHRATRPANRVRFLQIPLN